MEEKTATCKDCPHFLQHYILGKNGQYRMINCGHCIAVRIKSSKPYDKTCDRWYACEES